MSATQKESRGQASLVSKMTFLEVWRRLWLLIVLNTLIIILFFSGLIVYSETLAANSVFAGSSPPVSSGNYTVSEHSARPTGVNFGVYYKDTFNIAFTDHLPEQYEAVSRNIWFVNPVVMSEDFFAGIDSMHYSVGVRQTDAIEKYWLVTFTYPYVISIFRHFFAILLILEAIGLFVDSFDVRKSIRKSLRPIYDLTLVAQNINSDTNPAITLPGVRELHLSGAIDTLNNITEDDLSRRIVISDEREELRGLASAINAMLDRLDAAYRSQLRFVSDASHELRTPIAVIQGYAGMLDRWGKNDIETLQESIDAIKTEAAGMQDLVEQLLFLARSDNRSIVLNVGVVDTCALADEVLRETQMIDPNHEFTSRLTEGLCVRGDLQLLKQALRIFVDNAIKYTPKGGIITISTVSEDDYAKISVSDTGIGISAQDLERVFDRFFRSDESRTRGTGGTGLGLSIAKWIIDRHGGFVELVSREDFGTKITIALPRYNDAPVTTPEAL